MKRQKDERKKDAASAFRPFFADRAHSDDLFGKVIQSGTKVKVYWTKEELVTLGGRQGGMYKVMLKEQMSFASLM